MMSQMELPPLKNFTETLKLFNLRKLYQYLLYFVKNDLDSLKPHAQTTPIEINNDRNNPTIKDRKQLLEQMIDVLTEGIDEVQIISVQRLIMGMMMVGHIHIFQLMISDLLPYFIQVIEEDALSRGLESQLTKFQQSQIHKPSQSQLIENLEQHRVKIRKKLRQFYKETFVVLAQWFPKNFYSQNQISWFRKVVQRYDIKCRFIVYFTLEKMNQFDSMIKKLRLHGNDGECKECLHCIQSGGEGLSSCQGLTSYRNIPSIIEEEQSQSIISVQPKIQKKLKKKFDLSSKTENSETAKCQTLSTQESRTSKIKELIKKRRQEKKSSISISQKSVTSNKLSKNRSETLLKKLREKCNSNSDYFNVETKVLKLEKTQLSETHLNKTTSSKVSVEELRNKLKQRKSQQKLTQYYQVEKSTSRFNDTKKILNRSQSMSMNDEKSLKLHSNVRDSFRKEEKYKIVFQHQQYKSLGFVSKKLFRKQCLKRRKKILNYSSEGITIEINLKLKSYCEIDISVNSFSQYSQKANIKLVEPQNLVAEERKNGYLLNFEREFQPVVIRINGKPLIIPITRFQLLEDYSSEYESKRIVYGNQYELMFKLDLEIFQDIPNIATLLGLKPIDQSTYENKFLYLKKPLLIRLSRQNENQCKISGKTQLSHQKKLEQLLKEIRQCLEKRSIKPIKMARSSQQKTFF